MSYRNRMRKGALYYVPGRKHWIAESTVAVSLFLAMVHETHPTFTVSQLRELITDRAQYIPDPEAIEVLNIHIKLGYGDSIPDWR